MFSLSIINVLVLFYNDLLFVLSILFSYFVIINSLNISNKYLNYKVKNNDSFYYNYFYNLYSFLKGFMYSE